ncbi:MAG: hypothetical protein U9N01_01625 [Euryarchaeota archaeon]|nr:hypothetical protein [Euryarchaeota archaeon]
MTDKNMAHYRHKSCGAAEKVYGYHTNLMEEAEGWAETTFILRSLRHC